MILAVPADGRRRGESVVAMSSGANRGSPITDVEAPGGNGSRAGALTPWPDLLAVCDRHGSIVSIDCVIVRIWGSGEEVHAKYDGPRWEKLGLPVHVVNAIHNGIHLAIASGRSVAEDMEIACDDTSHHRIVECRVTPFPGSPESLEDRKPAIFVTLSDVTLARRSEESLRESERAYRLLAANSTDMISRHDPLNGTYLYASPACRALFRFEPEELVGRSAYELIHPDDAPDVHRVHTLILAEPGTQTIAFRGLRKDGTFVWIETSIHAVRDPSTNTVVEIQCATRDISARHLAEQELRQSRELLQAVLDNSPAVVYIKDVQGRYLLVNRRFEQLFKRERHELIGCTDVQLFPEEIAEAFNTNDRDVIAQKRAMEFEEIAPHDDGPHVYVSVKFPLFDREGKVFAACGISTDITPRKRAEAALREQSEMLQKILDTMADAVIVADESLRFVVFNPAAERMFGLGATETSPDQWPDAYGLYLPDQISRFPADELPLVRAVRGESVNDIEIFVVHARKPEGTYVLVNGRPLLDETGRSRGGVIVCRDITERKSDLERLTLQNLRLQESAENERKAHEALKHAEVSLVQAEKLTALGQMVAGVAHEINNPLSFVVNNMAILQRDTVPLRELVELYRQGDPVLEAQSPELFEKIHALEVEADVSYTLANLERITERSREGLRRIQQIVKDLREFARLDDGDLQAVDLNAGIASTLNIIHGRAVKSGVELQTDLNPLPAVTCYPGKINQVVMNLLANAIDATQQGGKVTVRTESSGIEAETDPQGIRIIISDTGSGIPAAILEKIFDPFFTTKPIGQGTGLGLSISYGIVKAHGGKIRVKSTPGQGTTFTVWLPLTPQVPAIPGA